MSSEPLSYMLGLIGLILAAASILGFGIAWVAGLALARVVPRRARVVRIALGLLFVLVGVAMWRSALATFLIDALVFGIGVGFLIDAARSRS